MENKTIHKENYSVYQNRIMELLSCRAGFPPEKEPLATACGLQQKFHADGSFRPFYGDTVVFQLPEDSKQFLGKLQSSLYRLSGEMLSEPLPVDTMHITLHDLHASSGYQDIQSVIKSHSSQMYEKLSYITGQGQVHLSAKGMISMVSSSIVMLFAPVCEKDHDTIQRMYECLEEVRSLPYPLTLHCTLAYYKPGFYTPQEWNDLYQFINQWNHQYLDKFHLVLDCNRIEYQFFNSMREYRTIFYDSHIADTAP